MSINYQRHLSPQLKRGITLALPDTTTKNLNICTRYQSTDKTLLLDGVLWPCRQGGVMLHALMQQAISNWNLQTRAAIGKADTIATVEAMHQSEKRNLLLAMSSAGRTLGVQYARRARRSDGSIINFGSELYYTHDEHSAGRT